MAGVGALVVRERQGRFEQQQQQQQQQRDDDEALYQHE
tara:strand:- start:791 stop:904 length:114 start_codon:yes stop_codon:yes gene_type:complete